MSDKIKPLKLEDSTSGTELDMLPQETDPSEDLLAAKGLAFENTETIQIYSDSGEILFKDTIKTGPFSLEDLLDAELEDFDAGVTDLISTKTGPAIRELRDKITTSQGFPRSGIRIISNGTIGNNDWLGPTELLPNTPFMVSPVKFEINEISWGNQRNDVEFSIQFRTVSKTGTIFHTLTVTSPNPGYGIENGLSYEFPAGTAIYAQYIDDGFNMSDAEVTLWISRVP